MILPIKKQPRAFTLIELLMVVSIITIVAGVTIPSFSGFMKNQTIKNAQEQFKSDLRSIQNLALTGSKYETSVTWNSITSPATYWVAKWVNGGSSYQTYIMYDIGTAFETTCAGNLSSVQQASYTLPGGITFNGSWSPGVTSLCANECLFFNMQDGSTRFTSVTGASCATNNQDTVIIVLKNESGSTAPVSWNRNGTIAN